MSIFFFFHSIMSYSPSHEFTYLTVNIQFGNDSYPVFDLRIPVDRKHRRETVRRILPWIKTVRRSFDRPESLNNSIDRFLSSLGWVTFNDIVVLPFEDFCSSVHLSDVMCASYHLEFTKETGASLELQRDMSSDDFCTEFALFVMLE